MNGTRSTLLAALLVLALAPPFVAEGAAPPRLSVSYMGGRPPVPLTLERPRLLMSKADLPALRERARTRYARLIAAFAVWLNERDRLGLADVVYEEVKTKAGPSRKRPLAGAAADPQKGGLTGDAALNLALLYQLTGDKKFVRPARAYLLAWLDELQFVLADWKKHKKLDTEAYSRLVAFGSFEAQAEHVMDLLWDTLSPEERTKAVTVLLTHAYCRFHSNNPSSPAAGFPIMGYGFLEADSHKTRDGRVVNLYRKFRLHGPRDDLVCLACYGKEADACGVDYQPILRSAVGWYKEDVLPYFRLKAGKKGGTWFMFLNPYHYDTDLQALLANAWQNASGEKVLEEPFMRGYTLPALYVSYPVPRGRFPADAMDWDVQGAGPIFSPFVLPARTGSAFDQHVFLHRAEETGWKRSGPATLGVTPAAAKEAAGLARAGKATWYYAWASPFYASTTWQLLAGWFEPDMAAAAPAELPETAHFDGLGLVAMRSSWEPDATFAAFMAGKWYGFRHLANLGFWIHKDVPLTFQPNADMYMVNVHNIVTVYNPEAKTERPFDREPYNRRKSDGGQTMNDKFLAGLSPQGQKDYFYAGSGTFDQARITGFETTRLYDYIAADATNSYPEESVAECTRQFVFLKPDHFIIFDRVTSRNADFPKRWNCHFYEMCEPVVEGDRFTARWTGKFTPGPNKPA